MDSQRDSCTKTHSKVRILGVFNFVWGVLQAGGAWEMSVPLNLVFLEVILAGGPVILKRPKYF